jgi:lipooligosaccharide transport system ATP-binding protein
VSLIIRLRGVRKTYGPITAVDGFDLDVPEGTCVGLLGPNGAGKSTTMKMLTAQAIADAGEIEVLGHTLPGDSKSARAEMGVVPQLDNLDVTLTVEQNLRALVHRPRLVLMDEPTVGLDPQVRQELWALIDALRAEGVTILMSTHYIEEAQRLADTVTIMAHGKAVAVGAPAQLVTEHAGREAIEVYGPPARLAEVEREAAGLGLRTRRTGTSVSLLGVDGRNGDMPEGERRITNLEDVFVLLTGEEIT